MKKGFTLVELSIVLVIIGLLIGGILVGQSLIDSAKISSQARQLQQFDSAAILFKSKFKYLVSDSPAHGGNRDGLITRTVFEGVDRYQGEIANYWNVLDPAKYPRSYPNPTATEFAKIGTSGADKNTPEAEFGGSGSVVLVSSMSEGGQTGQFVEMSGINKEIYYMILSSTLVDFVNSRTDGRFTNLTSTNSAATPAELLSLDIKLDDGIADTGFVLAGSINGTARPGLTKISLPDCSVAGDYTLSFEDSSCTPIIRVGGLVGDPQ